MKNDQFCIILMNYSKKLKMYSEVENAQMIATDFRAIIMHEFSEYTVLNGRHLTIKTATYKAYCGTPNSKVNDIEIDIYGSDGMKAFKDLAIKMDWQIFNKQTNNFT